MTCSLNTVAIIDDLPRIRAILLPHLLDSISDQDYPTTETDATDDEEAPTSQSVARTATLLNAYEKKKKKPSNSGYQWLRECHLAFSPTLNLLVTAFDQRLVVSTAKTKSSNTDQTYLTTSFDIPLQVESNERITSVLCLPIASPMKRSNIDWTCIIVGFTTGYVRMYTEDGILLFSQLFHDKPVAQIKCHTQFPSSIRSLIEQPDELYIQYQSSILVVIDGLSLYQMLKVCREHALKSSNAIASNSPQLSFKKWGFSDQEQIVDLVPGGLVADNRFDQFCAASMTGGYQAQIRPVPPLFTRFMTVGADPYCNFYYCAEGAQMPHFTEVAYALADKVKSSLMSAMSRWIPSRTSAAAQTEPPKPKIEPETRLDNRFAIRDLRRHGEKIIVSPGLQIAAVSDSFGRIIVYDIHRGIAIRMFKGYREAEIGFIQIEESTSHDSSISPSSKKSALFLIIHAPKRQLVEIWACQQGARVAAFNVSKNSRLINLEHYTLGWTASGTHSSKLSQYKQCILMEPNGEMKSFHIPFHLILSDRNNQRAHDLMLVRQVRRLLRDASNDHDGLRNDLRQQFKRLLSLESHADIFDLLFRTDYLRLETIDSFIHETLADLEKNGHQYNPQEVVHLQDFCHNALNSLNIYRTIEQYRKEQLFSATKNDQLFSKEEFQSELQLNDEETNIYYVLLEREYQNETKQKPKKVHFVDDDDPSDARFTFGQFQSMFAAPSSTARSSSSVENQLEIKLTINSDDFSRLGSYFFAPWFSYKEKELDEEQFRSYLKMIHLKDDDLVLLSIHALLSMPFILPKSLRTWKQIFTILWSISEKKPLIKTTLEKTNNTLIGLLLALIFRLNEANIDFTLLTRRLSALVAIKNLYSTMQTASEDDQSIDVRLNQLNVETIFLKHRYDYLLELIARRIVEGRIPASWLTINSNGAKDETFQASLAICRQILPHSFESTVLLIYTCWTSMSMWHKQLISPTNPTSGSGTRLVNELFQSALLFYNEIQLNIIKEKLGTLLWHTYLRPRIVALTQLIEKIGKIPKDRICQKELRMSEKEFVFFLNQLAQKFFNPFIEAIYNHSSVVFIFNIDDLWRNNQSTFESVNPPELVSPFINLYVPSSSTEENDFQNSLLELVMDQKEANGHLVLHHEKLIWILNYVMQYHLKSIRPYSLFDGKGIHAFFTDLHSHPLVTNDVDASIGNKRQLFFSRLLNTIFEDHDRTKPFDEKIFDQVLHVATQMLVDHEYLRRHYIALLYAYNYDSIAIHEENRVHDRQALALQLLTIAGLRLNHFIQGNADTSTTKLSTKSLEIRAKISSTLKTWFASLPTLVDYPVEQCSLEAIETMLTRIGYYLPQTNLSQSNLAQEMVELVHLLKRSIL